MNKIIIILFITTCSLCCKEKTPEPWCYSCENEKNIDTCYNVHAKVVAFWHDPINGQETTYGLTIRKEDQIIDGYVIEPDSCLIPCPPLLGEYKKLNSHVLISYYIKSCAPFLTSPDVRGFPYGRKIEIISINHN